MNKPALIRTAKSYLVSICAWSALSLLTGWEYQIFDQSMNLQTSLADMLLLAEARGFSFALLTPPIFYLVKKYASGVRQQLRYLCLCCVGVIPFLVVWACIRWAILPPWDASGHHFATHLNGSPLMLIRSDFADVITIYCATVLAAHGYDYFEKVRKQDLERSQYQQALAASELQALKMQLQPHFLFNTLHGISSLIDSDGESAKTMLLKLSSLLRMALEQGTSDLIQLHDELKFAREYLDLETMRFGARLMVTWAIEQNAREVLVPQLILQPLVENAIQHGVACSREKSWIEIASFLRSGEIHVRVRNSTGDRSTKGTGLGLRTTLARLRYLYANEAVMSFAVSEDRIATTTLVLPVLGLQGRMMNRTGDERGELHHARAGR